ncbi:hypothetical protein JOE31_004090 [Arthrobacter sp. PvP023]|uniref:hypothetical protein n=1 Tax=Micrococcaceae TaxID=1268 RepID=UPI001AE5F98B|nr:hypothetical protein [Arthrobacter sp. PvP023]MBP1137858.1 hypothetical protein [Arthrobacter sp. PvP023]
MTVNEKSCLAEIVKAQAHINELIGAGNTFGEIGERVAAKVSGSTRITGTGNDLVRQAEPGWVRPTPLGIAAETIGPRTAPTKEILEARALTNPLKRSSLKRYDSWVLGQHQLGEVKTRQMDRRFSDSQLLDTRNGGPRTDFTPLVDFYIFNIFDTTGDLRKCIEVPLGELVDYVKSDVGRGGAWNYKVCIGLWMEIGIDKTQEALEVLHSLKAVPELKGRRS